MHLPAEVDSQVIRSNHGLFSKVSYKTRPCHEKLCFKTKQFPMEAYLVWIALNTLNEAHGVSKTREILQSRLNASNTYLEHTECKAPYSYHSFLLLRKSNHLCKYKISEMAIIKASSSFKQCKRASTSLRFLAIERCRSWKKKRSRFDYRMRDILMGQ